MANKKLKYITFPAFSFEKILLVNKLRLKLGYSAFEVSFLLGKVNSFIQKVENPFETSLIDIEDTCQLAKIFNVPISLLTPANVDQDNYQLEVFHDNSLKRYKTFEISIKNYENDRDSIKITEEPKEVELDTPLFLSSYIEVQVYFRELIANGYFNNTRSALDIFNEFRAQDKFGLNFHPRYLIQNIRYFVNKKSGEPILDDSRTNLFSRRLFFKPVNFNLFESAGPISKAAFNLGLDTFQKTANWVSKLDYRRNVNKGDPLALFKEDCGTCSTKHALLKRIADENGITELNLMLGVFTMNGNNTRAIKEILKKYKLKYIPEAHNYLRAYNYILDFTGIGINETKFELDILEEIEIQPDQITDFKVEYHKDYLKKWIKEAKVPYSIEEVWAIREECIRAITLSRLELKTERLLMRPFKKDDGATMYDLNSDIEVLQYTGDTQFADVTAAEEFLGNYDQYEKYGVGRLTVILQDTGEILGWCGLKYHPEKDEYDIGYRFFKKHWGKGYATESAKLVMEDGFAKFGMKQIVGRARVENTASIHVFDKLGMQFVEEFVEDGENWVLYKKEIGK